MAESREANAGAGGICIGARAGEGFEVVGGAEVTASLCLRCGWEPKENVLTRDSPMAEMAEEFEVDPDDFVEDEENMRCEEGCFLTCGCFRDFEAAPFPFCVNKDLAGDGGWLVSIGAGISRIDSESELCPVVSSKVGRLGGVSELGPSEAVDGESGPLEL